MSLRLIKVLASTNVLASAAALVAFANPACAQQAAATPPTGNPAPAASAANALPEIVVTARRRAESMQSVPVAVTAVPGAELQRQNIVSSLDLPRVAPALNTIPSGGVSRNLPLYAIRGQQQGEYLASTDPSVGIYFGDTVVQRAYGADLNLFDLSQVEVLKGPQGTLFGRNTTGGNIIFHPNMPVNRFEGGASVQTGSYNLAAVQAYINIPITDNVSFRLAGNYRHKQGYLENVYPNPVRTNIVVPGDINSAFGQTEPGASNERFQGENGGAIRASLNVDLGKFKNDTVFTYITSDTEGSGYRLLYLKPNSVGSLFASLQDPKEFPTVQSLPWNQTRNNATSYSKIPHSWIIANTSSYGLSDNVTVKNIFGYHNYKSQNFEDIDGSALPLIEYGADVFGWELNDELQISGEAPGLKWIAGAYYFKEDGSNVSYTTNILGFFDAGVQIPSSVYEDAKNESKSLFASATKNLDFISPDLSFTFGGRYTWDDRAVRFGTRYNIGLPNEQCALDPASASFTQFHARFDPAACMESMQTNFSKFTYTASLDWKLTPSKLVYLATRSGYRSGGFNTRGTAPSGYGVFVPEVVRDVEVGFKGDWNLSDDVSLRTNVATYYQWYKNIQRLLTFTPCPTCVAQTVIQNAASAHIYGGEAEFTLRYKHWLELRSSAALVRPVYDQFVFQGVDYAQTATFGGVAQDQVSVGGTVYLPTPETFAETSVDLNWYHQSGMYNQDDIVAIPQAKVPAYSVTNLRVDFNKIAGSKVDASLAVNNLFDDHHLMNIYSLINQLGFASGVYAPPREWTITLRYAF